MAYPTYYPNYPQYPQNYPQAYQPPVPTAQTIPSAPQQPIQPQMQNGGFISVRSIEEAQRYPVAPGNAVTFKIEGLPIVCEKSQGFSQLEAPRFEVFDLVKRDVPVTTQEAQTATENNPATNNTNYVLKEEIEPLTKGIELLKNEVVIIKEQINETTPKKTASRTKKEEKDGEE